MMHSDTSYTRRALAALGMLVLAVLMAGCSLTAVPDSQPAAIAGAPVVRIIAPLPASTFLDGVTVNIQVLISNAGADIARVDFAIDDAVIAAVETPNTAGTAAFSLVRGWQSTGSGAHTARVTAVRADGTTSEPAVVSFTVQGDQPLPTDVPAAAVTDAAPEAVQAVPETAPTPATDQAAPTNVSVPTAVTVEATLAPTEAAPVPVDPPVAASGAPVGTFLQGTNVRRGPSTLFVPAIGSFAAGQTAEIIGLNLAGDWYKIRYYNAEGWILGTLVSVEGDISTLPREAGPPLPTLTPQPPTAVVITAPPAATVAPATSNADLVAGTYILEPNPLICNQASRIELDVANLGTTPTTSGGVVSVVDRHDASGTQTTTEGAFPVLQPGQTFRVTMALTVSVYVDENHTLTITVNPSGTVPESNRTNNSAVIAYRLARGGC